jgi:hypothetical protein
MSDYSLLHRAHEALKVEHTRALAEIERLAAALAKVLPAPLPRAPGLPQPHRNDHDA